MKIGILTFHRAENFGAVIQCYALQTYLQSMKYDVYVIDYRCKAIERGYSIFNPFILFQNKRIIKNFGQYIERLRTWKDRKIKKRQYELFRNQYLNITRPIHNINQLPMDFDVFIVGSDQVWNSGLTGGIDKVYFLDAEIGAKKIAYAASSEWYAFDNYQRCADTITLCLEGFRHISVREERLRVELSQYTSKTISVCLDPTFLLAKEIYKKMAFRPKYENYILVYHLSESFEMTNMAKRISTQTGQMVIEIHAGFSTNGSDACNLYNLGPIELLGYILHSGIVLTTSFHGLAFSLIFEKNFWVIDNGVSSRQKNLLQALSLENRIVPGNYQGDLLSRIDYSAVSINLEAEISNSKDYLETALTR